jgi:hypothetical protein
MFPFAKGGNWFGQLFRLQSGRPPIFVCASARVLQPDMCEMFYFLSFPIVERVDSRQGSSFSHCQATCSI